MYGYHDRHEDVAAIKERAALIASHKRDIEALEAEIAGLIANARKDAGSWNNYHVPSWEVIGEALGVSKQAARKKYGS